ncbi:hypothetical protein ACFC1B_30035 [Streptomyces xiamenensis]|uniref:hypothetical protein n=1 Tax=Streptomyces TaxID=1883 RepID=UPI000694DF0D|nr:hypothetical protein [Streptomyces sp. NRRL F-2890]
MNTHTPDDFLDAALLPPTTTRADLEASRERIRQRVSNRLWQQALHEPVPWALPSERSDDHPPGAPHPLLALSEHAAHDLREICVLAMRDRTATRNLAGLVNNSRIEPEGAFGFACLLHLADRSDAAQFWWQFTAGAGHATAALCLFLLHMRRGDTRDAAHWAAQATLLDTNTPDRFYSDTGPTRVLYRRGHTTVESMLLRTRAALADKAAMPPRYPDPELTEAIRSLQTTLDDDFGDIPQPDPVLADHLAHTAA